MKIERIVLDRVFTHKIILMQKGDEPDVLPIGELEYMPTANRRRWMRDYMKEYRQGKLRKRVVKGHLQPGNPTKLEKLRKTQRLQSFKWRIAQLLSPQYEILMYAQYQPAFGIFGKGNDNIVIYAEKTCNNVKVVLDSFPILEDFKDEVDVGGGELFKVFNLRKFNRKFNRITDCVVGVLDKAALLKHLQQLTNQGGERWEIVLNKATIEEKKGGWRKLDFSEKYSKWWEQYRTVCQPLKWTTRDKPRWNSSELHNLLSRWAMGTRRIGLWQEHEALGASDAAWRGMISPIFGDDEIA